MRDGVAAGLVAGVIGGIASGIVLRVAPMTTAAGARAPALRLVAGAVHTASLPLAAAVYVVYGAALGALFGWLVGGQRLRAGAGVVWGVLYGVLWWLVSLAIVIPALRGLAPLTPAAVDAVRAGGVWWLAAMLLQGAVVGAVYALLGRQRPPGGMGGQVLAGRRPHAA
jgi:hypothetical protein